MALAVADPGLYSLIYISRASDGVRADLERELDEILAASQANNHARDVSGVLIAHDGWFVQVLEGAANVIRALYAHIEKDSRHREAQVLGFEPIVERRYGAWGMVRGRSPGPALGRRSIGALSAAELMALIDSHAPSAPQDLLTDLALGEFVNLVAAARLACGADAAALISWNGAQALPAARDGGDAAAFAMALPCLRERGADAASDFVRCEAGAYAWGALLPVETATASGSGLMLLSAQALRLAPAQRQMLQRLAAAIGDRLAARSEERLAAGALRAAPDAILCARDDFSVIYANPAALDLFGLAEGRDEAGALGRIFPEASRAASLATVSELLAGRRAPGAAPVQLIGLRADGSEFPMEVATAPLRDRAGAQLAMIVRDASLRLAAETALAAHRDAAEAASRAKSAFLANISHELSTPLNGVVGLLGALDRGQLAPEPAETIDLALSSARRLSTLLGDVLEIVRLQSGAAALSLAACDLEELVRRAAADMADEVQAKGLGLLVTVEAGAGLRVRADADKVQRVVSLLLRNAVKFTPTGQVALRLGRTAQGLFEISVRDTGVGIEPADRARIFDAFEQAEAHLSRRFEGAGLGLSIVRQLVEVMGGEILCESAPGAGSTFTLRLTLEVEAEAAAPDAAYVAPECDERPLRALVADDNPVNRRVLDLMLRSFGAEAVCVEDGAQALEALATQAVDLVLMDMMMPVMDGLTATQALRRREAAQGLSRTPVIMVSANSLPEHIEAARLSGVDLYLGKPVQAPQLLAAVLEAVKAQDEPLSVAS
jgi:PAS domain S-box-containing protein